VGDDDDRAPVVPGGEVAQEASRRRDDSAVTLPFGVGLIDVVGAGGGELRDRHPVLRAVVALAQAGVPDDRQPVVAEGQLRRLHGAGEVGDEDRRGPVRQSARADRPRQLPPLRREPIGEPAGRMAGLVVLGQGVCLVADRDGHQTSR